MKEDGTFNKGNLTDSSHVDSKEIEIELQAQIDKFIELCGHQPTHINSHHGIELISDTEKIVCKFSQGYDLPICRFFTLPKGNHPNINFEIPLAKFVFRSTPTFPDDLTYSFSNEEIASDDIFEFPLHPRYVEVNILSISSLTTGRAYDAYVFNCGEIKEWIQNHPEIKLVDSSEYQKL